MPAHVVRRCLRRTRDTSCVTPRPTWLRHRWWRSSSGARRWCSSDGAERACGGQRYSPVAAFDAHGCPLPQDRVCADGTVSFTATCPNRCGKIRFGKLAPPPECGANQHLVLDYPTAAAVCASMAETSSRPRLAGACAPTGGATLAPRMFTNSTPNERPSCDEPLGM